MEETNVPEPPEREEPAPAPAAPGPPQATARMAAGELPNRLAFLRNRLILGGLALVAVLLLIALVLATLGGGDDAPGSSFATGTSTPGVGSTAVPRTDVTARVLSTDATVRTGPGPSYGILGTIPSGFRVSVTGRDDDGSWLRVIYPPGTQLRGWIEADLVEVTGDVSQLAVVEPGGGPSVPVPTSPEPLPGQSPTPSQEPTATPTSAPPTATPPAPPTATPLASPVGTPLASPTSVPDASPATPAPPAVTPAAAP